MYICLFEDHQKLIMSDNMINKQVTRSPEGTVGSTLNYKQVLDKLEVQVVLGRSTT